MLLLFSFALFAMHLQFCIVCLKYADEHKYLELHPAHRNQQKVDHISQKTGDCYRPVQSVHHAEKIRTVAAEQTSELNMDTTNGTPAPTTMQAIVDDPIYQQLQNVCLSQGPSGVRDPDCTICLVPFGDEECLLLHECCGMSFHAECLLEWLTEKCSCPWCRGCLKDSHAETEDVPAIAFIHIHDPEFRAFITQLEQEIDRIYWNNEGEVNAMLEAELREMLSSLYQGEEQRLSLEGVLTMFAIRLDIMETSDLGTLIRMGLDPNGYDALAATVRALNAVLGYTAGDYEDPLSIGATTLDEFDVSGIGIEEHENLPSVVAETTARRENRELHIEEYEHGHSVLTHTLTERDISELAIEDSTSNDEGIVEPPAPTHQVAVPILRPPNRLDVQVDHQYEILLRTSGPIQHDTDNVEEFEDQWWNYWNAYRALSVISSYKQPGYDHHFEYRYAIAAARASYTGAIVQARHRLREVLYEIEYVRSTIPTQGPIEEGSDEVTANVNRMTEEAQARYRGQANSAAAAFRTRAAEARGVLDSARSNAPDGHLWPEDPPCPLDY